MNQIDITVQQDIVTVQRIFENRTVAPGDVITIKVASELLNEPFYKVSRWVGKELPLARIPGVNKRLTLRSAVMERKQLLDAAKKGGLNL